MSWGQGRRREIFFKKMVGKSIFTEQDSRSILAMLHGPWKAFILEFYRFSLCQSANNSHPSLVISPILAKNLILQQSILVWFISERLTFKTIPQDLCISTLLLFIHIYTSKKGHLSNAPAINYKKRGGKSQ